MRIRTTSHPARRSARSLREVGILTPADTREVVPSGAVVLDRDAQLGNDDVGPHLEMLEERARHPHSVQAGGELEALGEVVPQLVLDGGCRGRRTFARERARRRASSASLGTLPWLGMPCAASRFTRRPDAGRPGERQTFGAPRRASAFPSGPRSLLRRSRGEEMPRVALPQQQHLGCGRDLGERDARR